MPTMFDRRREKDGAAAEGPSFDAYSAGDVAVAQSLDMSAVQDRGEIRPFQRLPISAPEIAEAYQTLLDYKRGKANLERRLVDNQQWYKLRQWECMRRGEA